MYKLMIVTHAKNDLTGFTGKDIPDTERTEDEQKNETKIENRVEYEPILVEDDPLALPDYRLELYNHRNAIFYPDDYGRIQIKISAFAAYLSVLFKPVTYKGRLYIYNIRTGLYLEHTGEIPAEIQRICDESGYGGKVIPLKNELLSRMEDRMVLTKSPFDKVSGVPLKNCVLQIEEHGELIKIPYGPHLFVTCRAETEFHDNTPIPDFPEGEKFFAKISMGDAAWTNDLMKILGYAFLLGNPAQKYFVLYGTGGNGKGVLIEWILRAMGDLCARVSSREFLATNMSQRETSIAKNLHKRVIIASELGGGRLNDDLLKRLTGDASVSLNVIYRGEDEYCVHATPILVTNLLPSFDSGGSAMLRRQIAVPFKLQVPVHEQDPNLLERLSTPEGNRWLLAKIIAGAVLYMKTARKAEFWDTLSPDIQAGTSESFAVQDPVGAFVKSELVYEEGARTPGRVVFERWYEQECGDVQRLHEKSGGRGILRNVDVKKFYDGLRANGVEIKKRMRISKVMECNVLMNQRLKSDV